MYKINGYYYLFAAQGGTVWTHQEVVARSKTLDTLSFETEPGDPFITNFDTPELEIQKQPFIQRFYRSKPYFLITNV